MITVYANEVIVRCPNKGCYTDIHIGKNNLHNTLEYHVRHRTNIHLIRMHPELGLYERSEMADTVKEEWGGLSLTL